MNITLSVDQKVVEKARRYAKKQDTSLNDLIRSYLEALRYSDLTEIAFTTDLKKSNELISRWRFHSQRQ